MTPPEVQMNFITLMIPVGITVLAGIGIKMFQKLDDLCTRVSKIEGAHQ